MSDNRAKAAGVDELLWPLTQVSADPTNLTKFDADGNVLTSSTDVVAAVVAAGIGGGGNFVAKTGDTMTGPLTATTLSANSGRSSFVPADEPYAIGLRYNASGLPTYIGTSSAGEFQVSEPGGSPTLRVATNGNMTSPGTSHSFVANSIPLNAVNGAVNKAGDTITGNMVFQGTSNTFAQGSISSTAIGPLVIDSRATTAYTLALTDMGKVIYKTATANTTLTLPTDAAVAIPVGSVVEIVNNAATGFFYVKANTGVNLFYNSTLGAGSDGLLGGGAAVQIRLRGPMTSARIMKQGANSWAIFGDLVTL